MLVVCLLELVVNHFFVTKEIEGRLLAKSDTMYLVDFSEDLKKIDNLDNNPNDFKRKLIDREKCILLK